MQDHDFEKQVHRKMEELSLLPSDAVWTKVEAQIHRREKRRQWILWLPLLLLPATGAYLLQHPSVFNLTFHPIPADAKNGTTKTSGTTPLFTTRNKPTLQQDAQKNTGGAENIQDDKAGKPATGRFEVTAWPAWRTHRIASMKTVAGNVAIPVNNPGTQANKSLPRQQTPAVDQHPGALGSDVPLAAVLPAAAAVPVPAIPHALHPAAVTAPTPERKLINTTFAVTDHPSLPVSVVRLKQKSAWEWRLSAEAGRSGINNGRLTKLFPATAVADITNGFTSPGSGTGNTLYYPPPSTVQPARGISFGISVGRQIASGLVWRAGLQYTRYTTTLTTGKKVDSAYTVTRNNAADTKIVHEYYVAGSNHPYTNRYHYITLPLSVEARIIRSNTVPVYWNLGIAVSRLLATNSLHYNSRAHIYYQDKRLLNTTQLDVVTGLDVRLFRSGSYPLQIGPYLHYGATSVLKEASGSQHFLFLSLKASVILQNKK